MLMSQRYPCANHAKDNIPTFYFGLDLFLIETPLLPQENLVLYQPYHKVPIQDLGGGPQKMASVLSGFFIKYHHKQPNTESLALFI